MEDFLPPLGEVFPDVWSWVTPNAEPLVWSGPEAEREGLADYEPIIPAFDLPLKSNAFPDAPGAEPSLPPLGPLPGFEPASCPPLCPQPEACSSPPTKDELRPGAADKPARRKSAQKSRPGRKRPGVLVKEENWEEWYVLLLEFIKCHRRLPLPSERWNGQSLGFWVYFIRLKHLYDPNRVDPILRETLQATRHWTWALPPGTRNRLAEKERKWHLAYRKLEQYVKRHGRLPHQTDKFGDFPIGSWACRQRSRKRENPKSRLPPLTKQQIKLLEKIPGWSWDGEKPSF